LRFGIETASNPRTIVFDVSGNIRLKSKLEITDKAFLTIAGQTAPGDGITICDWTLSMNKCHDIIIRYIRQRLGDRIPSKGGLDAMMTNDIDNVILDHVSVSWGIDGNHDLKRGGNFTLQWCIIGEALNNSLHKEGQHGMLGSYRNPTANLSLHHNVFTSSRDRHPTLGAGGPTTEYAGKIVDFRNNIIYNWSKEVYSDEANGHGGATNFCDNMVVAINNIWRPGPESNPELQPISIKGNKEAAASGFMSGNIFDGNDEWTKDNYAAINFKRFHIHPNYKYRGTLADWKRNMPEQGDNVPVTHSAKDAFKLVLKNAGSSLHRDAVDKRLVKNIKKNKGKLIDSQDEVGGWPTLNSLPAPLDTDRDGMPDVWEKANKLDPSNPKDRNGDLDKDGFTNLEEYMNSLVNVPL
jgi:hypothetical protein